MKLAPETLEAINGLLRSESACQIMPSKRQQRALAVENMMQGPGLIYVKGLDNLFKAMCNIETPLAIVTSHETDQDLPVVARIVSAFGKVGLTVMSLNMKGAVGAQLGFFGRKEVLSIPWDGRGSKKSPSPFRLTHYDEMLADLNQEGGRPYTPVVAAYNPPQYARHNNKEGGAKPRTPGSLATHLYLSGIPLLPATVQFRNPDTGRRDYTGPLPILETTDAMVTFGEINEPPTPEDVKNYLEIGQPGKKIRLIRESRGKIAELPGLTSYFS